MADADARSLRQKLGVFMAAILAAFGIFSWNLVVRPKLRMLRTLKAEKKIDEEKKAVVMRIAELEKKLTDYRSLFSEKKEASWFVETLNQLADEANLSLTSVTPASREGLADYERSELRIELKCGYHELGEFISRIENYLRFIKIRELRMEGGHGPANPAKEIKVSMTLSAYYPTKDVLS